MTDSTPRSEGDDKAGAAALWSDWDSVLHLDASALWADTLAAAWPSPARCT